MPKLIQKITTEVFPFSEPIISGFGNLVVQYGSGNYIEIDNAKIYLVDLSQASSIEETDTPINFGVRTTTEYKEYKLSF
jgi:hypothetical protein|tara:strand:+ start:9808 stop:10044 length:237 start_codon:yes stop_codon:yes gene_type:complete